VTASTTLLAVLLLLVPGAGVALALFPPGRASLAVQAGVAVPLGYALAGAVAFLLALAHLLVLPVYVVALFAATIGMWFAALRRHGVRERLQAWRDDVRRDRWTYLLELALLAGMTVVRMGYSGIFNLHDQTPVRYWADGLEIADAHRIPALSLQWGHLFPSTVSKVFLNCFDAAASLVLGRGPVAPMGAVLFVVALGIVLAGFALARVLGLRLTAALFVLLLFANRLRGDKEFTIDLIHYRAEDVGRLLLIGALVFAVLALRSERFREGRRDALVAGALLGMLAGTHLVPFGVGSVFVGSYALARAILHRRLKAVLQLVGGLGLMAALVGAFVLIVPPGAIGFSGVGDASAYKQLAAQLGEPPCWDPTLYLTQGKLNQTCRTSTSGFYNPPRYVYDEFVRRSLGLAQPRIRYLLLLPLLYLTSVGVAFLFGSKDLAAATAASALLGVALLLVTLVFSWRSNIYVVAQFGERRLFDYTGVPVAVLGLGLVEVGVTRLGGMRIRSRARPWLPIAAVVAASVLAGAILIPRDTQNPASARYLATALAPFAWIERNVPCGGRILSDRRTLATFEVFSRHAGVIEGMGPYLRPDVLIAAIPQMLAARRFFLDPAAGEAYLREQGVAAVVVTAPDQPIGGTLHIVRYDRAAFDSTPFLQVAARSASVTVYRVVGFATGSGFPSVVGLPGYGCGVR
jgi:hypothetical protein